jgi:Mg2+ and Co2+ transporter CorA
LAPAGPARIALALMVLFSVALYVVFKRRRWM